MKNIVLLFLLTVLFVQSHSFGREEASADEHLAFKTLIEAGKWEELTTLFPGGREDKGYRTLKDYFSRCKSVKFAALPGEGRLTYKAKFHRRGEAGVVTFEKKDGKYTGLKIENQIRPLYFIERFQTYSVSGERGELPTMTLGDAVIRFKKGTFYQPLPFKFLLLFDGEWEFSITPNDEEERLTLKRMFKSETLVLSREQGIFITDDQKFMGRLSPAGEVLPGDKEARSVSGLLRLYNEKYGIKIPRFDEYWYLPFPDDAGLAIFRETKQSLYIYSYNRDSMPDTQLVTSGDGMILLSYNCNKGLKLTFGTPGPGVNRVSMNLFYNPADDFISGIFSISYPRPAALHMLQLDEGLNLLGYPGGGAATLNVFRKREKYYLLGTETDKLSLYYKGNIRAAFDDLEFFKTKGESLDQRGVDDFYFLSKNRNFYPNPGESYFQTDVTVSLPEGMNALISGNLTEKSNKGRAVFRYTSRRSKGISLVCGDFTLSRRLESKVPISVFCSPSFDYSNYLDLEEVRSAADFFYQKFGSPRLSALNILLKRGVYEGGISNTGFMVININPNRNLKEGGLYIMYSNPRPRINSPVLIRDAIEDHVFHELSHQWWGGLISWKTYNDVWITEGLAHFSVLYYLRNRLPARQFNRIVKKLKRWIVRYNDTGPISYGTRIHQLEDSYEAYQSVIYNKGAFLYLMLLDILGEEDFLSRLRSVLDEYAYQSVSLFRFTRRFSGENEMLDKFFRGWVFSRKIPRIRFQARAIAGNPGQYDVRVQQLNGDFVFPLKVRVVTAGETLYKTLVVKENDQSFVIAAPSPVKSVKPVDYITPLKIEK